MKQRFTVAAAGGYVLARPGWTPVGFAVMNPSDKPIYVREGAADADVGVDNYDYIVPAGRWLKMPTGADNFSASYDAATASLNATFILWDENEKVEPGFGSY